MSARAAFVVIPATLFSLGIARGISTWRLVRRAVRVRAKVVDRIDASIPDYETSSQSASTTRYVVELPLPGGGKRRVALAEAFGGAAVDRLVKDGMLAVLYERNRPETVRIDSLPTLYFLPAVLCAPAILVGLLVAYVWLRS